MFCQTPIVGGHFRPPANRLMQVLQQGHPLRLQPEPANAYDPNAVKVLVQLTLDLMEGVPQEAMEGYGLTWEQVQEELEDGWFHLGYLAAKLPKGASKEAGYQLAGDLPGLGGVPLEGLDASFGWGLAGEWIAEYTLAAATE